MTASQGVEQLFGSIEANTRAASGTGICFNGATRLHAWKQENSRYTAIHFWTLQWSHASSRVETRYQRAHRGARVCASMEPRVFTRGNTRRKQEEPRR